MTKNLRNDLLIYSESIDDLTGNETKHLSSKENSEFIKFKINKRKMEWLAGRISAKRACYAILSEKYNLKPNLNEIEISNEKDRAPIVTLPSSYPKSFRVSITHANSFAVCGVTDDPNIFPGVDLVYNEPRNKLMLKDFFNDHEKELIIKSTNADEAINSLWAVKEAVSKSLLKGMLLVKDIIVKDINDKGYTKVELINRAKNIFDSMEFSSLLCKIEKFGEYIFAYSIIKRKE